MRQLVFVLVLGWAWSACGQTAPVADRVAKQNALFEEFYQTGLKNSPERATAYGDYRYNSQLGQVLACRDRPATCRGRRFSRPIKSDPDRWDERQRFAQPSDTREAARARRRELRPEKLRDAGNQQNGVHTRLADLPNAVPFDSVPHYQDYISRLKQIPRVLEQTTEVIRQGEKDGLMPPRLVLEKLPGQCDGIIAANPFLEPTKKFPAEFSDADKKRLTDEITKAINDDVLPAYKKFAEFLRTEYDQRDGPSSRSKASLTGNDAMSKP